MIYKNTDIGAILELERQRTGNYGEDDCDDYYDPEDDYVDAHEDDYKGW